MTRSYSFGYGGITIGGASSTYLLEGPIRLQKHYRELIVGCNCLVTAGSASAFETARLALEAAFRNPFQDVTLTYGATVDTYSQSTNTGFLQDPSITPDDQSSFNSDTCREYILEVRLQLPADHVGDEGVDSWSLEVTSDAQDVRILTVRAEISALGNNDAQAQWDSIKSTFLEARRDQIDVSADWKEIGFTEVPVKEDKSILITYSFRERIFPDSIAQASVDDLRNTMVTVDASIDHTKQLAAIGVARTITLRLEYVTGVLKSSATASEPAMRTLWSETILPKLKEVIEAYAEVHSAGADEVRYLMIAPEFEPTTPFIRADILAEIPGGPIRELMISRMVTCDPPWRLLHDLNNVPFSKSIIPAVGELMEIVSVQVEVEGDRIIAEGQARAFLDVVTNGFTFAPSAVPAAGFGPGGQPLGLAPFQYPQPYRRLRPDELDNRSFVTTHRIYLDERVQFQGPVFYGEDDEVQATACMITAVYDRIVYSPTSSAERERPTTQTDPPQRLLDF